MNIRKTSFAISLLLAAIARATPLSFTDADIIGAGGLLIGGTSSFTGDFNIVSSDGDVVSVGSPYFGTPQTFFDQAGYSATTDTLSAASITFYFKDDNDPAAERVSVKLNGNEFLDNMKISSGSHSIFGGSATVGILSTLSAEGRLTYSVTADAGDFLLEYAVLQADVDRVVLPFAPPSSGGNTNVPAPSPQAVPDTGGTVLLLGLGLLLVGAVRFRR